eukprot:TRINITY_DN3906_c0_g1_i9.p1 TRINITY_DN3906_c0_g1~~TRINITY_DN3906_c0_g1_i9.p1  ORF type:complete len:383 (+),score=101.66 TRINITY_DN3906_c0_g1_i9:65-1213(+)
MCIRDRIKDCESAILLETSRYEGFFRRGICNFYKRQHAASIIDFETAATKLQTAKPLGHEKLTLQIQSWQSKNRAEMATTKVFRNKNVESQASTSSQPTPASASTNTTQAAPAPQIQPRPAQPPSGIPAGGAYTRQSFVTNSSGTIIYSWHQNNEKVVIFIKGKVKSKDAITTHFEEQRFDISFPTTSGDYDLSMDLYDKVVPETAKVTANFEEVEIHFEKKTKGVSWLRLDAPEAENGDANGKSEEKKATLPPPSAGQAPSYPSSSRVKKDWSKIDKEIEADMKKNKEYDEDPMNAVFKEIYASSDENTRRAMIKSFQTSGGTVLSTNWKEVAQKDYEGKDRPAPPQGMEYKKNQNDGFVYTLSSSWSYVVWNMYYSYQFK